MLIQQLTFGLMSQRGSVRIQSGSWYGSFNEYFADPQNGETKRRQKTVNLGPASTLDKNQAYEELRKEIERAASEPVDRKTQAKIQDAIEYLMSKCGYVEKDLASAKEFLEALQRAVQKSLSALDEVLTNPMSKQEVQRQLTADDWEPYEIDKYLKRDFNFDCSHALAFKLWIEVRAANRRKRKAG